MKRYFLGLALALLAIPGVSRADVIQLVVTNTGAESQGDTLRNTFRTLSFDNTTSSSNALHSMAIRLYNTSVGGNNRTGTLNFDFSINGGSAIQRSASITLDALKDYSFIQLSGLVATGGINALTISNASISSGNITLDDLKWTTLTNVTYSGIWSSGASVSPTQTSMGLYATVPEPTTMVLYGSAIAIGFGASVLRRFRKKSEELSAV
jgi:hypothetical protein